jgi:predicted amidophosphoribosyltransferase
MLVLSRCSICESPTPPFYASPCDVCARRIHPAASLPAQAPFESLRARWLLVGTTYRIFLSWKSRPTPRLDRLLLEQEPTPLSDAEWAERNGDILVPIPQRFSRAWRLSHSPALRAAQVLSRSCQKKGIRMPVVPLLKPGPHPSRQASRQASLRGRERWARQQGWSVDHSIGVESHQRIILVDDVLTTGATLVSAASALRENGHARISAWTLGVRPSFSGASATTAGCAASNFTPNTCSSAEATP